MYSHFTLKLRSFVWFFNIIFLSFLDISISQNGKWLSFLFLKEKMWLLNPFFPSFIFNFYLLLLLFGCFRLLSIHIHIHLSLIREYSKVYNSILKNFDCNNIPVDVRFCTVILLWWKILWKFNPKEQRILFFYQLSKSRYKFVFFSGKNRLFSIKFNKIDFSRIFIYSNIREKIKS